MATKPPAKAAPKSAGKAATKPAPKTTPVKKSPAKPGTKKPVDKPATPKAPAKVEEVTKTPLDAMEHDLPWEESSPAEQQAEINDLAAMMAQARASITPNDTARPEPIPTPTAYRDAVNVERKVATAGPGTLSMSDIRSSLTKPEPRVVHSSINRLFNLR